MKVPVILFKDFMLRDISIDDANDMYQYGSDLDVVKYLSWGPYETVYDAKLAINNYFFKRPENGLPIGYAIVDLTNNKMIGTCDFHTLKSSDCAEIGYCLNKDYHNRGIMTKVLREVLLVGFNTLGYNKIVIGHAKENIASKRVIEKSGFKYERTSKDSYYNRFDGTYQDVLFYYLTKGDIK